MFVRNKTPFAAALAHGMVAPNAWAGAIVVRTTYRAEGGGLVPCEPPPPLPTDPPDLSRSALWGGTSVTAAGDVYGPPSAPFQKLVTLTVGGVSRHLLAFGERRWARDRMGELSPSAPAPFERLALSFSRAYGGHLDLPPGPFPGTDLPFPGGRLSYTLNPGGVGFYADKAAAGNRPLPSFELANRLLKAWSDHPLPGCFVPCPELPGLRAPAAQGAGAATPPPAWEPLTPDGMFATLLRARHHAPGYLVLDEVPAGTPVQLEGVGRGPIRFEAPPPPVRVTLRRRLDGEPRPPELRSLHVDADRGTVSCVHGYGFLYEEGNAPSWILVEAEGRCRRASTRIRPRSSASICTTRSSSPRASRRSPTGTGRTTGPTSWSSRSRGTAGTTTSGRPT